MKRAELLSGWVDRYRYHVDTLSVDGIDTRMEFDTCTKLSHPLSDGGPMRVSQHTKKHSWYFLLPLY